MNTIEWPNNAPYVLCITHDVDRVKKQWYHYLIYCKYGIKKQAVSLIEKLKGDEPYWNFEKIVELEKKYGATSTFFFLNETHKEISANFIGRYKIKSKKMIDIIRWLEQEGAEIGLHGSYYSYNNLELLADEKYTLESITGHKIVSTRQHFLNHDDSTMKIQREIGLKYDSTIGNKKTRKQVVKICPYFLIMKMVCLSFLLL